jgi:hypothetical protein
MSFEFELGVDDLECGLRTAPLTLRFGLGNGCDTALMLSDALACRLEDWVAFSDALDDPHGSAVLEFQANPRPDSSNSACEVSLQYYSGVVTLEVAGFGPVCANLHVNLPAERVRGALKSVVRRLADIERPKPLAPRRTPRAARAARRAATLG